MASDPWKDRNKGMICQTCVFFILKKVSEERAIGKTADADKGRIGRCRRHAPTMNGYPVVFEMDWCGDHKVDENKV